MIEIVDGLRRPFGIADPFEAHHRMALAPIHHPGSRAGPPLEHRTLVHWNANQSTTQPENSKTDEDEEDDDDRPFTPPPPRERLSYTRYQLELLNAIYTEVRYPNSTQKQLIAKRVGITRDQVKIWFQNRRRKDVVGNTGKSKSGDTSTSSVGSSKDSGIASPTPDGNESSSSSDDISSQKDTEESVVPDVVMKSVINELKKFVNDPLKGKKNKKKYKAKKKDQNAIKKGLSSTLLSGSYDMISPPNQITPSAFFEKLRNGFNHSKSSSAFANPRDSSKPAQSSIHPSLSTSESVTQHSKTVQCGMSDYLPFSSRQHPLTSGSGVSSNYPPNTVSQSSEISSLADILSYKSCLEARHKEMMSSAQNGPMPSAITSPPNMHRLDTQRTFHPGPVGPSTPGRYIPGIYPYPFLAEQPMLLSSLRQPDHLFRPAPQYALSHYTDDPYQPLLISSLSNPYYSPPSSCWSSQTLQSPPTNSPL